MKRIEVELSNVKSEIGAFYNPEKHHFIVINALDLGDKMEVQWIFHPYFDENETIVYFTFANYNDELPSIAQYVASAWVAESEFVDLFGMKIENTQGGFLLEPDSEQAPLRRGQ